MAKKTKQEIVFDKNNYRQRGQESEDLIGKSLDENGAGRSIVIDSAGAIVAGNGVYKQALERGMKTQVVETTGDTLIVVKRTDLAPDDPRRKNLALADNAIPLLADWDFEAIRQDFGDEDAAGWGVFMDTKIGDGDMEGFFKPAPQEKSDDRHRLVFELERTDYDRVVSVINAQDLSKEEYLVKLVNNVDLP